MRLLNAAIVALALLATLGGFLQEKKRLASMIALSPAAARTLYEKAQLRRERVLMLFTGLLVAGAIAALIVYFVTGPRR
jgi:hypothetical protein